MPYDSLYTRLSGPYGQFNLLHNRQGMGRLGRDKGIGQDVMPQRILRRHELREIYRANSMIQRVVNYYGDMGTRRWLEPLQIGDETESDVPEDLKKYWKGLRVRDAFKARDRLARQFGGAVIFIGADDGQELAEPLNLENIKSIQYLKVFDRWEIYPAGFELDRINPEMYEWYPSTVGSKEDALESGLVTGVRIHSSRVLRQDGADLPDIDRQQNDGWGDSVIQGFIKAFVDYVSAVGYSNHMLASHDIWIQSIKGLADIMSMPDGEDNLLQRVLENFNMLTQYGMFVQDAEMEGSSYVSHSFGGVSDVLDRNKELFTAATGVPHYRIWGTVGESGLADSGGAEKQAENDLVQSHINDKWLPDLEELAEITFAADDFEGEEPDEWELQFKQLYEPTEMEKADLRKKNADTDKIYVDMAAIAPEEVRQRFTGTEYATDLVVPEELPESLQPQDPLAGLGLEGEAPVAPTAESAGTESPTESNTEEGVDALAGLNLQDAADFKELVDRIDAQYNNDVDAVQEDFLADMDRIGRQYERFIRDNYNEWSQRNLLLPAQQEDLVNEIRDAFRFDRQLSSDLAETARDFFREAYANGELMASTYIEATGQTLLPVEPQPEEELDAIFFAAQESISQSSDKFSERAAVSVANQTAMGVLPDRISESIRTELGRTQTDVAGILDRGGIGQQSGASKRVNQSQGLELVQLFTEADDRVCPYCAARAYNVYRADQVELPFHPNCRCTLVPYKNEWVEDGTLDPEFFREDRARIISLLGKQRPNFGASPSEKYRGLTDAPRPVRTFTLETDAIVDALESVPLTRNIAQLWVNILQESAGTLSALNELEVQYDPETDEMAASGVFTVGPGVFDFTYQEGSENPLSYAPRNPEDIAASQVADAEAVLIADARNCTRGYACGNSCQSLNNVCKTGFSAEQQATLRAVKGEARKALAGELTAANEAGKETAASGSGAAAEAETSALTKTDITVEEFDRIKADGQLLGAGEFGEVYLADGQAVKLIKSQEGESTEDVLNERFAKLEENPQVFEALAGAGVPPAVTELLIAPSGNLVGYKMDYVESQDLYSARRNGENVNPDGYVEAIRRLHDADIAHGDLHEHNLVVAADGSSMVMDYGVAELIPPGSRNRDNFIADDILYLNNTLEKMRVSSESDSFVRFKGIATELRENQEKLSSGPSSEEKEALRAERSEIVGRWLSDG